METINLTFPTSWSQLDQRQLLYIFTCIAAGYSPAQIKSFALVRWNHLDVMYEESAHSFIIKKDGHEYIVSSQQIAELLPQLDYLSEVPSTPIRLEKIKSYQALPADFQEVPFDKFIMCDNLYQGYLHTNNSECISDLAAILYDFKESTGLTKAQEVSVFYWWTSLKHHFGNMFPNFFKPAASEDPALGTSLYRKLSESMNAQIRALTKGDITKEKEVLSMDTWRALTELDAQAKEYDELNRKKH